MLLYVVSSSPPSLLAMKLFASLIAPPQVKKYSAQLMITLLKPASLPPIVIVTRLVELLSVPSWLLLTFVVFAPLHAWKLSVYPFAAAIFGPYASGLRLQLPDSE